MFRRKKIFYIHDTTLRNELELVHGYVIIAQYYIKRDLNTVEKIEIIKIIDKIRELINSSVTNNWSNADKNLQFHMLIAEQVKLYLENKKLFRGLVKDAETLDISL